MTRTTLNPCYFRKPWR